MINIKYVQSDIEYSEADLQNLRRIDATKNGNILWRNNVGALRAPNGAQVRFGLANDSKGMNNKTKSSDLIGIIQELITPEHVGRVMGIFNAEEVKRWGWTYTGTPEEKAQLNFHNIVRSLGGYACFTTGKR